MYRPIFDRIIPFVLAYFAGVSSFYLFTPIDVPPPPTGKAAYNAGSGGSNFCKNRKFEQLMRTDVIESKTSVLPLQITFKPKARYTDIARQNGTEGVVRLKVELLGNGSVGIITVISGLPDGLTEMAVEAARKIEFEPKRIDGVPSVSVVTIDYSFDLY